MAFIQIILNVNQIVQCGIFRARYQFKGYRLHLVKVQAIAKFVILVPPSLELPQ